MIKIPLIDWRIFSLIRRRHHCRWRAAKFWPMHGRRSGPLSREGSLSCHTCCDMGPRFFLFHPKDSPIQSPLTTHEGMWRIYSNPDSHGDVAISDEVYHFNMLSTFDSWKWFFHVRTPILWDETFVLKVISDRTMLFTTRFRVLDEGAIT
jgi:hypothetical protein